MTRKFNGRIGLDVRESIPDWSPYEPPKAPEGAPNILYVVWDDVGFGAFDFYGGLIEAPNMRRIADRGLIYTQFHTTALCSPTRSCLLTGRNATSNGMACITEGASGFPGSNGRVPFENALISEVLVEHGYSTFAVGKWHLTPAEECHLAGPRHRWPLGRGFERYYGFLGGETDQYYPALVHDNHSVNPPAKPADGYHLSVDLADKAIEFIRDSSVIAPEKPWMMYFCPGAGHAPHQVPKEWADKYAGKFDMGYEKYREIVLENQKRMGLVPKNSQLPPLNPYAEAKSPDGAPWPETDIARPWETLSSDEKRLFSRMAEVYAGFVTHCDAQIGRIFEYLDESNQIDNTIVVVVSDNGASGEGGPNGSVNENKFFNGVPDSLQENMKYLDELGSEKTYNHYPNGWAMAFCTPFKMYKRYAGYEGGTSDPLIVSWPKGIKARGEVRHQYLHAIDVVPTLYECLGIEPPYEVKGYTQSPIEGLSFKTTFEDAKAPGRTTQFYAMLGTRGVYRDGWHAATIHPAVSGWGDFASDEWELFNMTEDRSQVRNLAAQYPDKLEMLKSAWYVQAGMYKGLPLDDRTPVEILSEPRPQPTGLRDRYVYYPGCAMVPESVAVNLRGRSFDIATLVTIEKPDAEGILFSMGTAFGGQALYLKDRKLHYVYNYLGEEVQKLSSRVDVGVGQRTLGVRFRSQGGRGKTPSFEGMAALYIDDANVAEAKIRTQPGAFGLSGGGVAVGRSEGQPISSDYETPFELTGGTIRKMIVDVSGERYRDLAKEAEAMFARD